MRRGQIKNRLISLSVSTQQEQEIRLKIRAGILKPTQRTSRPNNYDEHQVQLITFDT